MQSLPPIQDPLISQDPASYLSQFSWGEGILQQLKVIKEKEPNKANDLFERLMLCNWTRYDLHKLSKEGLDVSKIVPKTGFPSEEFDEEELSLKISDGVVKIVPTGSRKKMLEMCSSTFVPAILYIRGKGHTEGRHVGVRVLSEGKRTFKRIGMKEFGLIATGRGSFSTENFFYEGGFMNNFFHDLSGNAQLHAGGRRYTGSFRGGKAFGYGKLELYDQVGTQPYLSFIGEFQDDRPKSGTVYADSEHVVAYYRSWSLFHREDLKALKNLEYDQKVFSTVLYPLSTIPFVLPKDIHVVLSKDIHGRRPSPPTGLLRAIEKENPQIEQIAFGKSMWEKHFGDVGEVPALPDRIYEILQAPCPYWQGRKVAETHFLVLVPKTVNGKEYSINLLGELVRNPLEGFSTGYDRYWPQAKKLLGKQGLKRSYWALVTRGVIPQSMKRKFTEQLQLKKESYRVCSAIDLCTAILMNHVRTGERLFGKNPTTYSVCKEVLSGSRLIVGGFDTDGLDVSNYVNHTRCITCCGLAVSREL